MGALQIPRQVYVHLLQNLTMWPCCRLDDANIISTYQRQLVDRDQCLHCQAAVKHRSLHDAPHVIGILNASVTADLAWVIHPSS